MGAPVHLRPAAELAERVLLPGDPHRALAVAQAVLSSPRMFNHARGLWGYSGLAADGELLSVQSTGMGGPSAAIVVEELIELGARTLIRIGTCGALNPALRLGELVVASEVLGADGASAALGYPGRRVADGGLTGTLAAAGARQVTAVSTDLFYDFRARSEQDWRDAGADVVEMEAAALLAVAARRGARAAVLLAVTDQLAGGRRRRLPDDDIRGVGIRLGEAAFEGLAADRLSG